MTLPQETIPSLDVLYAAITSHPRTVNFDFHGLNLMGDPSWSVHLTIDTHGLRTLASHMRYMSFHAVSVVSLELALMGVMQKIDAFLLQHGEGECGE